jgi:hypothetical protein
VLSSFGQFEGNGTKSMRFRVRVAKNSRLLLSYNVLMYWEYIFSEVIGNRRRLSDVSSFGKCYKVVG